VPVKSILYDADGNEVGDEALAVRGTTVEVDDDGKVVSELDSWDVDRKEVGDHRGGAATRPSEEG
jgi:hypothetical protein